MGSFSERMGYAPAQVDLEESAIPERLRNQIWNVLRVTVFDDKILSSRGLYEDINTDYFQKLLVQIWHSFFGEDQDLVPIASHKAIGQIKSRYQNFTYPQYYEFLEFLLSRFRQNWFSSLVKEEQVRLALNRTFESNRAAFRVVDRQILPITNEGERTEVESAMQQTRFKSASEHLKNAAAKYSDVEPDYANSVKESILAVESALGEMTAQTNLNFASAIDKLKNSHDLHPSLAAGMKSYYGWTSDEGGIRHGLKKGSRPVTQADARLMLITCSAFVNYLISLDIRL